MLRVLLIVAALVPFESWAGYSESDVTVCGVTTTYKRYGVEMPGIRGSYAPGHLENQLFRVSGVLNVRRESNNDISQAAAISDFRAALQVRGIRLCMTGELYWADPSQSQTRYTIYPTAFALRQSTELLVRPSKMPGIYLDDDTKQLHSVHAVPSAEVGQKYYVEKLPSFLRKKLDSKFSLRCDGLPTKAEAISFAMDAVDRMTLVGETKISCADGDQNELSLRLTFRTDGLTIEASHPLVDGPLTLTLRPFVLLAHSNAGL